MDLVGKSFFLRVSLLRTYLHTGFVSIIMHSIDQGLLTIIYFFWNVFADSFFLFYSALNRMFQRAFRFRNDYLFVEFVSAVRFAGTEMTRTDKS